MLSGWQQVTLLEWLEKVKALSKKSTEEAVGVFPRNKSSILDMTITT